MKRLLALSFILSLTLPQAFANSIYSSQQGNTQFMVKPAQRSASTPMTPPQPQAGKPVKTPPLPPHHSLEHTTDSDNASQ